MAEQDRPASPPAGRKVGDSDQRIDAKLSEVPPPAEERTSDSDAAQRADGPGIAQRADGPGAEAAGAPVIKQPERDARYSPDIEDLVQESLERIKEALSSDSAKIDELNKEILAKVKENESAVKRIAEERRAETFGEKVSDLIARFGGSWPFVGIFSGMVILWITYNSIAVFQPKFDPYPFIFLNLMLSCLAALQAPIILMSQNAQAKRDRDEERDDYIVNLKAEIELRLLHEKIDHLQTNQWRSLMEIQEMQVEMLEAMRNEQPG